VKAKRPPIENQTLPNETMRSQLVHGNLIPGNGRSRTFQQLNAIAVPAPGSNRSPSPVPHVLGLSGCPRTCPSSRAAFLEVTPPDDSMRGR
jgi:hypothetical protein